VGSRTEPLGRPRHRSLGNIKMNLRKTRCGGMDWADPAQGRGRWRALGNMEASLRVPQNEGKFLGS
jgi:hypothetical protein